MTNEEREEAIQYFDNLMLIQVDDYMIEALDIAIKALSQPQGDLISRQAAIDTVEKWLECNDYNEAERHIMRATQSMLYDLPSSQPDTDDIVTQYCKANDYILVAKDVWQDMKSQPKTGYWIEGEVWEDTDGGWGRWQKCSVCRQSKHHKTNFCPDCGAKMSEPQERSNKG